MGVICTEVSGVLAVLLNPLRNLLKYVRLSAGNTYVRGWIRSCLKYEFHAEFLAGFLHNSHTAAHGLISHVTREGNMYKCITAQFMSSTDDQVTTGNEVVVADQVSCAANLRKILMSLAGNTENVRAGLFDLTESLGCAGNRLVHDDCLHLRIIRKVYNGLDGGL